MNTSTKGLLTITALLGAGVLTTWGTKMAEKGATSEVASHCAGATATPPPPTVMHPCWGGEDDTQPANACKTGFFGLGSPTTALPDPKNFADQTMAYDCTNEPKSYPKKETNKAVSGMSLKGAETYPNCAKPKGRWVVSVTNGTHIWKFLASGKIPDGVCGTYRDYKLSDSKDKKPCTSGKGE